jgi:hypothetical protein
MTALIDERLLTPVDPKLHREAIDRQGQGLLTVLDRSGELDRRRGSFERTVDIPLIHREKMGDMLARAFVEAGVARPGEGPWIQVEERTAAEFMTHLATTLGAWHDMVPITNRKEPLTTVGISLDDPDGQRFEQALLPSFACRYLRGFFQLRPRRSSRES